VCERICETCAHSDKPSSHAPCRQCIRVGIQTLRSFTLWEPAEPVEPVCAGPFVDARDCPVHAKDVYGYDPFAAENPVIGEVRCKPSERWMVLINREGANEITFHTTREQAIAHADRRGWNWSETYVAQVVRGPLV
jgi:hypothetical protein